MMRTFDAIVVGTGGIGSSALFHLAELGLKCLGIDRYSVAHSKGSSHGETRAIRKAYFEHPSYVPLLHQAYDRWRAIENSCKQNLPDHPNSHSLFFTPGLLEIGPPDGLLIKGIRNSVAKHSLQLEEYQADDFRQRFPGFSLPDGSVALFEPDGGYLLVEECVRACCQLAVKLGAEMISDSPVLEWKDLGEFFEVRTGKETFHTKHLVITAGAWANDLLISLGIPLQVTRKHLHWFDVTASHFNATKNSPVFFYQTEVGFFYGFPSLDGKRIKVAEHSGGVPITGPQALSQDVDSVDRNRVVSFLKAHLDGINPTPMDHQVCMYTMSADEHFIVDCHPENDRLAFAAGMSGHGFKFASVLGERLAKLVIQGERAESLEFLRLKESRFRAD